MIVLGADTHKRSHTIAAVSAATGELLGEQTVEVGAKGFAALVVWARELGSERAWAIEDCRHVSGHGRRAVLAGAGSPTASTPSPSLGRRCAKGWMRCRRHSWRALNWICGCSSTTASG